MLGVIGAMSEEVQLLLGQLTAVETSVHADIKVILGNYKGTDIALAQSGIGKVNATICTQMLIDLYKPDRLVFSGVAGGLLPNMSVGDLIIASHLIQFDVDLTAFGRRHGELPDTDRMIQSAPELVQMATDAYDATFTDVGGDDPNLMIGTIVSAARSALIPLTILILMEADRVTPSNAGLANGIWFAVGEVGGVTGPLVMGLIADSSAGFTGGLLVVAGLALATAIGTRLATVSR